MRIGIIGDGQLGLMLAHAAQAMGFSVRIASAKGEGCACSYIKDVVTGLGQDAASEARFAEGLDVITYELEHLSLELVQRLATQVPVHPTPDALAVGQDRLLEKQALQTAGLKTAPFAPCHDAVTLREAAEAIGFPALLKTRRDGYDGKGQWRFPDAASCERFAQALARGDLQAPTSGYVLEGHVDFHRELSLVACRAQDGQTHFYPPTENHHEAGILRLSRAPAQLDAARWDALKQQASAWLTQIGYVGTWALELFDTETGLVANEMAPRVHNSGHWTQNGAHSSQFENHIRAITGQGLGSTEAQGHSAMINLIGDPIETPSWLALPAAHLHDYGKHPRPGRKLGHVNLNLPTQAAREALLATLPTGTAATGS